jgi:hypothetical protein
MAGCVISMRFGIDEESDGLVRELLDGRQNFLGIWRIMTAIDENDSFLGYYNAARRISFVGGLDIDPIFDFGKARTEILRLNRKGNAQKGQASIP